MADDQKKRRRVKSTSGRVTASSKNATRYTPPVPVKLKRSSRLVPILMFGFFGLGVAIILLNYLPGAPLVGTVGGWLGLPKDTDNAYLLIGLLFICLGFGAATKYS